MLLIALLYSFREGKYLQIQWGGRGVGRANQCWGHWVSYDIVSKELALGKILARLRVMFAANGKRQIQVENFSE